jgi:YidC/Oxa1 family membrane protein insertase
MGQQKNFVLFLTLSLLIMLGWMFLERQIWPPRQPPPAQAPPLKLPDAKLWAGLPAELGMPPGAPGVTGTAAQLASQAAVSANWAAARPQLARKPEVPAKPKTERPKREPLPRVTPILGDRDPTSPYFIQAVLDSRGAGVRSVILNRFQKATPDGRPAPLVDGKPQPLELVQASLNQDLPSHLLFHYGTPEDFNLDQNRPLPELGETEWAAGKVVPVENGEEVSFTAEVGDVVVTKTFTLHKGDYHLGLDVKVERARNVPADREVHFRYQLTSAHGLPIEGEWFTYVFRNALIGEVNGAGQFVNRDLQDENTVSRKGGGEAIDRKPGENRYISFGGVAVQYFAAMTVISDQQQGDRNFLARARPTVEWAAFRGRVKSVAEDRKSFTAVATTSDQAERTFYPPPPEDGLQEGSTPIDDLHVSASSEDQVLVIYRTDKNDHLVARAIYSGDQAHQLWFDDIGVRLITDDLVLKPGTDSIVQKYVLYNGPAKVRLLSQMGGIRADDDVRPEVVNRYLSDLHLDTITDWPSNNPFNYIARPIGLTWLVIQITNLLHTVLYWLYWLVGQWVPFGWGWGLCIILLTVMVRLSMFPVSRKQTLMGIKMQEMAPELKKLQEKYKDDRQTLGIETMALYRKHGVNPFGSCWLILLQMPIFIGLYICLQESIFFRLSPFLWIQSLSAPDMLFWWQTPWFPWISEPQYYGAIYYLGPYFNLLPVIATVLMIMQQKLMAPPATSPEQEAQMKMMKYMMIFMGLMFYKVAAGLCIYFIATSLWGFAERKLLPKKKPNVEKPEETVERTVSRWGGLFGSRTAEPGIVPATAGGPAVAPAPRSESADGGKRKSKRQRRRERERERNRRAEEPASGGGGQEQKESPGFWQGMRDKARKVRRWWAEVLRKAEKR